MPAPLAAAVVAAIARAAVSNAAKKRLMQAAAKKVSEKEIKELIRTEMQTGAPKLGRANRRPDVANAPKRVVKREGQTGAVAPKKDPAKELYNLYKKKPDTKTVTKSMQKERVTPADVIAKRIAQKNERVREGIQPSRVSKPPKREGMTEDLKAKQKALALAAKKRSDKEQPIDVRNPAPNPERPPKSELAAFSQLSKAEQKNYNRIEARINEAIKASRKAEKDAAKKKQPPKRTK
jgi:hypothetical protein